MELANTCPGCGSRRLKSYPAHVAPFLADRIWHSEPFDTKLLVCEDCTLSFYEIRPNDDELGLLYQGYRSESYQRQRQTHEPGYTPEINASLGGENEMATRRRTDRWIENDPACLNEGQVPLSGIC